jgi:hypothetical protein
MQAGSYMFVIALEYSVVGDEPARHSAMGIVTVTNEMALDPAIESKIESDITHALSCEAKQQLAKDGYIMIDDEIKTLSFSLMSQ